MAEAQGTPGNPSGLRVPSVSKGARGPLRPWIPSHPSAASSPSSSRGVCPPPTARAGDFSRRNPVSAGNAVALDPWRAAVLEPGRCPGPRRGACPLRAWRGLQPAAASPSRVSVSSAPGAHASSSASPGRERVSGAGVRSPALAPLSCPRPRGPVRGPWGASRARSPQACSFF